MLNRIPQNIITSTTFLLLGFVGLWFSIDAESTLFAESRYSLLEGITLESFFLNKLLYLIVVLLGLFLGIKVNDSHKFVEGNNLPLLAFCKIGCACFSFFEIHLSTTIGMIFLLFSLSTLLRIHNQNTVLGLIFMSTFFIGIATLFLYPAIIHLLIVALTITFFRPFEVRNYIMMLVGFGLPIFYFYSFSYLFNLEFFIPELNVSHFFLEHEFTIEVLPIIILIIISAVASVNVFSSRTKFIVRQRNQLFVIVSFILLQLLLWFLVPAVHMVLTVLPLLGFFFLHLYKKSTKKWVLDVSLLLLLSSIFWVKTLA